MKRAILVALMAVGCLVWVVSAQAQVPKQLCLRVGSMDLYIVMAIKAFGSPISFSSAKVKFYEIHGENTEGIGSDWALPISGTGRMMGNIFHFSLTGSAVSSARLNSYHFEGTWNMTSNSGAISWSWTIPGELTDDAVGVPLSMSNCKNLSLPETPRVTEAD